MKQITDALSMDESQMHPARWKKSDSKATYYVIPFI